MANNDKHFIKNQTDIDVSLILCGTLVPSSESTLLVK